MQHHYDDPLEENLSKRIDEVFQYMVEHEIERAVKSLKQENASLQRNLSDRDLKFG